MKRITAIILFIIILPKVFGQTPKTGSDTINVYSIDVYDSKDTWKDAKKVSVNKLLKNPKNYRRKLISVYGYVTINQGQEQMIYESKESFQNKDHKKAILYAQFTEDTFIVRRKFKEGYAIVTGLFSQLDEAETKAMIYEIRRIDIPKVPSR